MPGSRSGEASRKPWARMAVLLLSVLLALAFGAAGGSKLMGAEPMVALFDQIGLGQGFRILTGTVEVVGAALLLWPRGRLVGALLLAPTMVGAIGTHVLLIGGSVLPATILLLLLTLTAYLQRRAGTAGAARNGVTEPTTA